MNNEVEYEAIKDEKIITEVKLRFARTVEHSILFGNVSYLELFLDGRGKVKRTKLKYPGIVETGTALKNVRSEATVLEDLSKHCNSKKHLKFFGNKVADDARKTDVTAAVKAWIPIEKSDGSVELTPGMGFYSEIALDDTTNISKVILVPFDKALSVDDERMKKTYSFAEKKSTLAPAGRTFAPVIRRGRK
ncbi:MAG TPA: hypothetical protein VJ385_03395 [Fibrobacteria bacterium]|nr:hypothetical protein [Fibrobacteria bacterium]